MAEADLERVTDAQENGQWEAPARRERVEVTPADLERAWKRHKGGVPTGP